MISSSTNKLTSSSTAHHGHEKTVISSSTKSNLSSFDDDVVVKPPTKQPNSTSSGSSSSKLRHQILRILLLDLPLLIIFAAYIAALTLELIHTEYLVPLKSLLEWNDERRDLEVTSYHYVCSEDDITASVADELVIEDMSTTKEALDHMQVHGVSMYKNILQNATADAVRSFIVQENQRQEGWFVINNKNRYSWGIEVDQHPSIAQALHEIAHHPVLRPVLDRLVGRNPAVIEFTAITSEYGAAMQNYHQDVVAEGSAAKYSRSFIPSYSLFIPLQDTTSAMGATDICPGTQLCADDPQDLCLEHGFSVASGRNVDKWPKGWGALLNQQTTHRGTAHTDKFGPERVVFILTFAPRPQYSLPGVIESRLLGQSGSYSLHWKQWGHTLDDFGAASQKMTLPFRILRSLGIYKPSAADWGWDIVTVALMRMANGDNGYARYNLEEFVDKGGFAYLPKWLQAPIIDEEDFDSEDEEAEGPPLDGGWHLFLVDTFQLVKEALRRLNQVVAMVFVVGLCIVAIWTTIVHKSPAKGFSVLMNNTYRILFTHGMVLGLVWLLFTKLSSSHWARHIQNGKLFQPYRDAMVTDSFDMDEISSLGFTLPNKRDVLVTPHYKSKYLASYANILQFNQKGNGVWASLVTTHSRGFDGLTPALQSHLCRFLVHDRMLSKRRGRLLYQPEAGRWAVMSDEDAEGFCHRELMMDQNPLIHALVTEIDYLETETKFGTWRDMAIHKSTIPNYLKAWSDRLLAFDKAPKLSLGTSSLSGAAIPLMTSRDTLSIEGSTVTTISKNQSQIPSSPDPRAPFRGAWFSMGDVVEGMYRSSHNEWYKGIVVEVSVDQDSFDVVYDDGEEDFGLCRRCVRPFKPYHVGEHAEARVDPQTYERVEIVGVHDDGTFAIQFVEDYYEEVYEHVPTSSLRRFA